MLSNEVIDLMPKKALLAFLGNLEGNKEIPLSTLRGMVKEKEAPAPHDPADYLDASEPEVKPTSNVLIGDEQVSVDLKEGTPLISRVSEPGNGADVPDVPMTREEISKMIAEGIAQGLADAPKRGQKEPRLPERISDFFYDLRSGRVVPYSKRLALGTQMNPSLDWEDNQFTPCARNGGMYFLKDTNWKVQPSTGHVRKPIRWKPLYDWANSNRNANWILCDRVGTPVTKFAEELPTGLNVTGNDPYSIPAKDWKEGRVPDAQ